MRAMTPQQAGVVDPVLSTYARGYANQEFIAQRIAPAADVPSRSNRQIRFGKDGFRRLNTRRAPGAPVLTVQYGFASDPVSLVQDALQGLVPVETAEEASRVPGINMGQMAVKMVLDQLDLGLEIDTATLLRAPTLYAASNKVTLAGTDQWSDYAASDPKADVKEAREAIRRQIGRYPNKLTLGAAVFSVLTDHPKVKEQFKYTSSDSITEAMLARYFEVDEVLVGKAIYLPDGTADNAAATDVWGKDAILAYVPTGGNWMVPSFAYTYRLMGYPMVESPWYDRDIKSWKYPTTMERRPYAVGADAGFLFTNAVA
jgi:Phage major capsid protein E